MTYALLFTTGLLAGWGCHWLCAQTISEPPVPQRPGAQPERGSDQPAKPPDVGTVVQEPERVTRPKPERDDD